MSDQPIETRHASTRDILVSVGAAVYEWTIRTDVLVWSANAPEVLGLTGFEPIATGARYEALLDPATPEGRADALGTTPNTDDGGGVPFRAVYRLRPRAAEAPGLWIEDVGRWYADRRGRPERAQGLVRVLAEGPDTERRRAGASRYDPLTGQLERGQFLAALAQTLASLGRTRRPAAFLLAAVDGLREANAAFGLAAGDALIRAAAERIRRELRAGDLLGRYSGNRLGILVMDCDERAMAVAGERFAAAVRNGLVETEAGALGLSVTIGGVQITREAGALEAAMLAADHALDRARDEAPGRFRSGTAVPERLPAREAEAARRLGAALAAGTLGFAYGPRRDCIAGRTTAYRLEPHLGADIGAGEIAALAEAAGLSPALGLAALGRALADLGEDPDLHLVVPVAAAALTDPRFLALVRRRLGRRPETARRLTIALAATALARAPGSLERALADLRAAGLRLGLTHFGAGPMPLDAIQALKPDEIELAAALLSGIADEASAAHVAAVIVLAQASRAEIAAPEVAEHGVAARLRALGLRHLSGPLAGPSLAERPAAAAPLPASA